QTRSAYPVSTVRSLISQFVDHGAGLLDWHCLTGHHCPEIAPGAHMRRTQGRLARKNSERGQARLPPLSSSVSLERYPAYQSGGGQAKSQRCEHDHEMAPHLPVSVRRSTRWFSAAIYAASAETSEGESCAPPIGGITPVCSFGCATPWAIVRLIAARLPSPHSHLPFVRSDPSGVPSALDPWHPTHGLP